MYFGTWGITFCFSTGSWAQQRGFSSCPEEVNTALCSGVPAPVQMGSFSPWLAFHLEVEVWGSSGPGIQLKNMGEKKPRLLPVRGGVAVAAWATEVPVEVLDGPEQPAAFSNLHLAQVASGMGAEPQLSTLTQPQAQELCEGPQVAGKSMSQPTVLGLEQALCSSGSVTPFSLSNYPPTSPSHCSPAHWQLPEPPWNVTLHHPSPGDKHSLFTALQSPM